MHRGREQQTTAIELQLSSSKEYKPAYKPTLFPPAIFPRALFLSSVFRRPTSFRRASKVTPCLFVSLPGRVLPLISSHLSVPGHLCLLVPSFRFSYQRSAVTPLACLLPTSSLLPPLASFSCPRPFLSSCSSFPLCSRASFFVPSFPLRPSLFEI